jgi:arylsulfatase A-like enzyme
MNGVDRSRPFLLWVHQFGAHPPYYNGGALADELDPGYPGELAPKKRVLDAVMAEGKPLSPRDVQHLNALYDAAVQGSDHLVGALLEGLRAAGRLDHTLVIFAADHGEEVYQHNRYLYHSCSVYQTTLHVPLGFSAPGLLPAGARVPQTVELIDVLPTLLGLLGVPGPAEQHGRSLLPYLERPDRGGAGKPAFSEYGGTTIHTVLKDGWKLIDNPEGISPVCIPDAPPNHYPIGRQELYDLSADPGETRNLAAGQPARAAELAKLIRQRFAGLKNRVQRQDVPEDLKKELKSLGYVAH